MVSIDKSSAAGEGRAMPYMIPAVTRRKALAASSSNTNKKSSSPFSSAWSSALGMLGSASNRETLIASHFS